MENVQERDALRDTGCRLRKAISNGLYFEGKEEGEEKKSLDRLLSV